MSATQQLHVVENEPTAIQAFAAVMAEVTAVAKDGEYDAGRTRYNFRGIDGVMNAVGPALRAHGVVIVPTVLEAQYREVEVGANRTLSRECTVKVRYRVYGPGGDYFDGEVYGEALDSSDKGTAKATSVAYRIFLLQSLTIPTHEPDPDASRYERSEAAPPVPGFRSSLTAAIAKLSEPQREVLRAWVAEQGLPDRPALMDAEQSQKVVDYILHGLPMIDGGSPAGATADGEPGASDDPDAPVLPLGDET